MDNNELLATAKMKVGEYYQYNYDKPSLSEKPVYNKDIINIFKVSIKDQSNGPEICYDYHNITQNTYDLFYENCTLQKRLIKYNMNPYAITNEYDYLIDLLKQKQLI